MKTKITSTISNDLKNCFDTMAEAEAEVFRDDLKNQYKALYTIYLQLYDLKNFVAGDCDSLEEEITGEGKKLNE